VPSLPHLSDSSGDLPTLKPLCAVIGALMVCILATAGLVPSVRVGTWILGVSSFTFLFAGRAASRDSLHPVRIFGALWCFCLALASMRLFPLMSAWSSRTWLCVLTALCSFPFGVWIASRLLAQPSSIHRMPVVESIRERRILAVSALCLVVGLSALAYEYWLIGEIPILSDNPDAARMKLFGVAGQVDDQQFNNIWVKVVHPFVAFNKYAIFLALLVLLRTAGNNRKLIFQSCLIVLLGVVAFGSQAARSFLVEIAIVSLALVHYLRRRIGSRAVCIAVTALFLFVALYGSFRIRQSESAPLFHRALESSNLPVGGVWDGLAFGYTTVTISFDVFNRLVDDLQSVQRPSDGFLFYSFHRMIARANIQEFALNLYSGESITPTFLGEFYADYGYWGVLFGPLCMGTAYGWVYRRGETRASYYWIYVRAMFLQMLMFFPYVNLFSQYLTWIFDLTFMYVLLRFVTRDSALLKGRVRPQFTLSPDTP